MSLMVGSLSSGSSGPRPVISSRISETNSASSCLLSASRSTSTYCETSSCTCRWISSSGSFSSADRLISSINLRCSRTLASSNFSDSSGLDAEGAGPAGGCSGGASGSTVQATISRGATDASSIAARSGVIVRRAVKRPAIVPVLPRDGELELLHQRERLALGRSSRRLIEDQLAQLSGDLVAGLDLVERHAAIDRLAHEVVIVRDCAAEAVAERMPDVSERESRRERPLLETVDDHLRFRPIAEPLLDRGDELLGMPQTRHRRLADDEQLVGAEQNTVGPGEPGARHVKDDVVEVGRDQVEQARDHVRIE